MIIKHSQGKIDSIYTGKKWEKVEEKEEKKKNKEKKSD